MRGNHRSSRHAHWQSDKNRVGASEMELMKAVLIHNYGGPEVLRYGDAPRPQLGNGEVLIRVHAAGVNPVDWKVREGHLKQLVQYKFPLILGWGLSGVIEEVGPGVSKFKKGDEVFSKPDTSRDGAYAEYVVVRESEVALKPKSLHHVYAAAVPLGAPGHPFSRMKTISVGALASQPLVILTRRNNSEYHRYCTASFPCCVPILRPRATA